MPAALLPQPDLSQIEVTTLLHAVSDPVRFQIVRGLKEAGEGSCGSLNLPVAKSTVTHHMRVLREAGLITTRLEGNARISRLREDEVQQRFPGLLAAILAAD